MTVTAATARGIALAAHYGQTEKDGAPYINHLDRVASGLRLTFRVIGYLHDSIEDTWITAPILLDLGVTPYDVRCIEVLTHDDGSPYLEYVEDQVIGSGLFGAIIGKYKDVRDHLRDGHELVLSERKIKQYRQADEMLRAAVVQASLGDGYA